MQIPHLFLVFIMIALRCLLPFLNPRQHQLLVTKNHIVESTNAFMDHRELSAAIGDAHKHTLLTNVSHGLGCRTVQPEKLGKKISEWADNNFMTTDATTGNIDFESLKAL